MPKPDVSEQNFEESYVIDVLENEHGFERRNAQEHYDRKLCMDTGMLFEFIELTQPKKWEKLKSHYGEKTKKRFLDRLVDQLESREVSDVIRNGFKDRGIKFKLAYFKPVSGLNPEHREKYEYNQFSVINQVKFSTKNEKSVDVVLFLNGLPLFSIELKNHETGQSYQDAIKQYRKRNYKEKFFSRCLAHFAVDNDKVYYTTGLRGQRTNFLPFNKDIENPEDERGFKVSYLYHDVFQPDSMLGLLDNFIYRVEEDGDEFTIFPRYHQLDTVRRLVDDVHQKGSGGQYLIQHSAGSGKTFTISWLAHQLSQLYNKDDERVFDTIVVVSDRKVIDGQLQEAVRQFEDTIGTVVTAKHSDDVKKALEQGKNIVVSTLHKFPVVLEKIGELEGDRFAVIIDEAHSSQGGTMAQELNQVLQSKSLDDAEVQDGEEITSEEVIVDAIEGDIVGRQRRAGDVSYFAFTATPREETLELFGKKTEDGYKPFSLYSMKQAIEEGFILDVLENYINYKTYYTLTKKIEDDPEFESRSARSLLNREANLKEHAIEAKADIMLQHFFQHTADRVDKHGKAMIVTRSRLHAVRYKKIIDRKLQNPLNEFAENIEDEAIKDELLAKIKYHEPVKALVAFSGTVKDDGEEYTESSMNEFPQSQTKKRFEKDDYRILIVANKFQTGFDQPLLETMYVDKKLSGLQAVQTLSRLNRTHPDKESVTVLDFVNDPDSIQKAFQPYYDTVLLSEETDPNELYEMESKVYDFNVIDKVDVNTFAKKYWGEGDHAAIDRTLGPSVQRYKKLEEDDRREFRDALRAFVRQYEFVVQIVDFEDVELHRLWFYGKLLLKKLPVDKQSLPREVVNTVDLEDYAAKKGFEGRINLEEGEMEMKPTQAGVSRGAEEEEEEPLSKIVNDINKEHGGDLLNTDGDKRKVKELMESIGDNDDFQASKEVNDKSDVRVLFDNLFGDRLADMYEEDFEFYKKINENPEIKKALKEKLFDVVMG
jgi:type I restriction enzyme R subunit